MEEGRKLRNNLLSLSGNIINRIVAFFEGFSVSFEELINFISKNIMNQIVIIWIWKPIWQAMSPSLFPAMSLTIFLAKSYFDAVNLSDRMRPLHFWLQYILARKTNNFPNMCLSAQMINGAAERLIYVKSLQDIACNLCIWAWGIIIFLFINDEPLKLKSV